MEELLSAVVSSSEEDIVIVGAGICGLATSLALHRIGLKSLVLESGDDLRVTGFALTQWPNAWRALDALGIGDNLRTHHLRLTRLVVTSTQNGRRLFELPFLSNNGDEFEMRCVRRDVLVETMASELPQGTIRFGSKVVSLDKNGKQTIIHLADGTVIKAKVLIGCDGVNSIVAKWLGLPKPTFAGRSAIRGFTHFPHGHGFKDEFYQSVGNGGRFGILPCNEKMLYWFFTYYSGSQGDEKLLGDDPMKRKDFVLKNLANATKEVIAVVENTDLKSIIVSKLQFRAPWTMLFGAIHKGTVCVSGDAMHPMTPDIGQGGCSALEDGIVLAKCLAEALMTHQRGEMDDEEKVRSMEKGLKKYVKERRMRWFTLITTAFFVGVIQQSNGVIVNFLRDELLSGVLAKILLSRSAFDCGELPSVKS